MWYRPSSTRSNHSPTPIWNGPTAESLRSTGHIPVGRGPYTGAVVYGPTGAESKGGPGTCAKIWIGRWKIDTPPEEAA